VAPPISNCIVAYNSFSSVFDIRILLNRGSDVKSLAPRAGLKPERGVHDTKIYRAADSGETRDAARPSVAASRGSRLLVMPGPHAWAVPSARG